MCPFDIGLAVVVTSSLHDDSPFTLFSATSRSGGGWDARLETFQIKLGTATGVGTSEIRARYIKPSKVL